MNSKRHFPWKSLLSKRVWLQLSTPLFNEDQQMHVERAPKQFTPLWWKDVHKEIAIPSALQYTSCTCSESTTNNEWSLVSEIGLLHLWHITHEIVSRVHSTHCSTVRTNNTKLSLRDRLLRLLNCLLVSAPLLLMGVMLMWILLRLMRSSWRFLWHNGMQYSLTSPFLPNLSLPS